jgi:hypothetical protein
MFRISRILYSGQVPCYDTDTLDNIISIHWALLHSDTGYYYIDTVGIFIRFAGIIILKHTQVLFYYTLCVITPTNRALLSRHTEHYCTTTSYYTCVHAVSFRS